MKKLLTFILLAFWSVVLGTANDNGVDSLLFKAKNAYEQKDFSDAALYYQVVVDSGYQSVELFYNIGNAYFKQGDFARAILNYERAMLLDPTDEDVQFNLSKSKTYVVDKIEAIPEFFIKTWFRNTIVMFNSDAWAKLAIVIFILTLSGLLLFFVSNKVVLKKMAFSLSVLMLIFFLITGFFSIKARDYIESSTNAIIMAPTVTVKSSPDEDGVDVFIIHEGTKVSILRSLAGWYEVSIADGKQGWLKTNEVEKI